MEVDLNVKTKVTSMSIHEKGRENEKPKTNSGFYLGLINAEVDFKNCTVEIVINDIPVYRFIEGQESYQTESVADFLIAGTNKLEVVINPGATPATARDKFLGEVKKDISVSTRLVQYQDGDYFDVDQGKTLTYAHFRSEQHKSITYPHIIEAIVDLPESIPTWAWQNSEKLNLVKDQAQIINLLNELRDGFQNFNGAKTFKLNKISYQDNIKTHTRGIVPTMAEWETQHIHDINKYKAEEKGHWEFKKLNPDDLSLRLCANDRLVECAAKDWMPLIRSSHKLSDGDYFYYKTYIGKIDNQFKIIRADFA